MGSEAEYLYDLHIGDMAYENMLGECEVSLKDLREQRKRNLIGKYLIICDGNKSKKICYLQNPQISNKGYWTQFMSNAIGFINKKSAKEKIKGLKYNNPRVVLLDNNFKLINV